MPYILGCSSKLQKKKEIVVLFICLFSLYYWIHNQDKTSIHVMKMSLLVIAYFICLCRFMRHTFYEKCKVWKTFNVVFSFFINIQVSNQTEHAYFGRSNFLLLLSFYDFYGMILLISKQRQIGSKIFIFRLQLLKQYIDSKFCKLKHEL